MRRFLMTLILAVTVVLVVPSAARAEVSPRLAHALTDPAAPLRQADGTWAIWVSFTDKGVSASDLPAALDREEQRLTARALARRARVKPAGSRLVDTHDLPVDAAYVRAVTATGAALRRTSRWLDAISVNARPDQIAAIARLPFVTRVDLVAKFVRPELAVSPADEARAAARNDAARAASGDRWQLSYGSSLATLEQIDVPPAHELGLSGHGVIVGMLDSGFNRTHMALQNIDVIAQYDFVDNDTIVAQEPGDYFQQARHGTETLSLVMGFKNGELIGTAYGASAILAKTEDIESETPIEEDNWVAGIEWEESLGVDVVTSSLGYYYWYDFSDLDGDTAVTTIAADMAFDLGVCVFNSAGNERQNSDFPHILPPADGHNVLALAAVDLDGNIASFSSPGPTYDGRIKPDLSAQGVSNIVAYWDGATGYSAVDGTSFATPLVAGVAALILERVPSLTPAQVRDALKATADRTDNPDNDYGWGIVDAYAAVTYWGPSIAHTPLVDTEDTVGPYVVTATITDRQGLAGATLSLVWRVDGGPWQTAPLTPAGGDAYTGEIPGQAGGIVDYYLEASDAQGITIRAPLNAPTGVYGFGIGVDTIAPQLFHAPLIDQTLATWPPRVFALASDNIGIADVTLTFAVNGGAQQGPVALAPDGDGYGVDFPLAAGSLQVGDTVTYRLAAQDVAAIPNTTTAGPFTFTVVAALARVLVIDNLFNYAAREQEPSGSPRGVPVEPATSAADIAQWLIDAGYVVDQVDAADVGQNSLPGHDAVVISCGNNQQPLQNPELRDRLLAWVQSGGRLMIEGGDIVYRAYQSPPFSDAFTRTVLHTADWWGDSGTLLVPNPDEDHHLFLNRPHRLPDDIETGVDAGFDVGACDLALPTADALVIMHSVFSIDSAGVLLYDDNSGPDAGQIVFLPFDFGYLNPDQARLLTENALAYLTAPESPGTSSISGVVSLEDGGDASGITVTAGPFHSANTGSDGAYTIAGLWASNYAMTVSRDGYAPATRTVALADGQTLSGVDFTLFPVVAVHETASVNLPIPDNNPAGMTSNINVGDTGALLGVSVDIAITHPSIGQLVVTLTNPQGTVVTLHDHSGSINDDIVGNWPANLVVDGPGSLDDFLGADPQGDWTIFVADTAFGALGAFQTWGLNLLVGSATATAAPATLPTVTRVVGNAPNPFNPQTVIAFDLAAPGPIQLEIYDVRGVRVRRLVADVLPAGRHEVRWDGRDGSGRETASGLYFCRLEATGETMLHKMMLVR